jgi:hypothetical protein
VPRSPHHDAHRLGMQVIDDTGVMHVNVDCLTISSADAATALMHKLVSGVVIQDDGHLRVVYKKKDVQRVREHILNRLSKHMTPDD